MAGRAPSGPWAYAVSAADQLLLWHGQGAPALLDEPLRTRAVVLLAACITDRADGPDVSTSSAATATGSTPAVNSPRTRLR